MKAKTATCTEFFSELGCEKKTRKKEGLRSSNIAMFEKIPIENDKSDRRCASQEIQCFVNAVGTLVFHAAPYAITMNPNAHDARLVINCNSIGMRYRVASRCRF